jgi:hypothetical protein
MKLINKTDYDTAYLRKLIEWVRSETGLNPGWIQHLAFKYSRARAWSFSLDSSKTAVVMWKQGGAEVNPVTALAYVIGYMTQKQDSGHYSRGPNAHQAKRIVEKFVAENVHVRLLSKTMAQDDVDMLCAKAGVEGFDEAIIQPTTKAKLSPVQQRAKKAAQDLARWERKLKLAKGKVAKLQKRVAYYAKSSAK